MSQRNICFYSNSDKWSKAFLEELAKTPWVGEFKFICVDPGPQRPTLPKWLKQVPTLVIDGAPNPVKTDSEVMNWLYERKQKEMPRKAESANSIPAASGNEPMSYVGNEMGGGDAGYSFIDSDTSTNGDGGSTIPGTFTFLNGNATPGDRQGQMMSQSQSAGSKTKKEMMFDKQLDMYKQERDMGMPRGPARQ